MLKQAVAFGIFSTTLIAGVVLPAQADVANIQTVTDDIYIEGFDNTWQGSTQQENSIRRRNMPGSSSIGTVQDIYRRSAIVGEGNKVDIQSKQRSQTHEMRRPSRGARVYPEAD